MGEIEEVASSRFRVKMLYSFQRKAIGDLVEGKNVFIVNPTGSGKCVAGNTVVMTDKGPAPISELYCVDGWPSAVVGGVRVPICARSQRRVSLGMRIVLADGTLLETSKEHRSLVYDTETDSFSFKEHSKLSGNELFCLDTCTYHAEPACIRSLPEGYSPYHHRTCSKGRVTMPEFITADYAYFAGAMIGDGSCSNAPNCTLTNMDLEVLCRVTRFLSSINVHFNVGKKRRNLAVQVQFSSVVLWDSMVHLGFDYSVSGAKHLPQEMASPRNPFLTEFLRGLFDTDGCGERYGVSYSSKSLILINQLRSILQFQYGIFSTARTKCAFGNNYYEIKMYGDDARLFTGSIGFTIKRKQRKLDSLRKRKSNTNIDLIPPAVSLIQSAHSKRVEAGESRLYYNSVISRKRGIAYDGAIRSYLEGRRTPSRHAVKKLMEPASLLYNWLDLRTLMDILKYRYVPIRSVSEVNYGGRTMYDLSTGGMHVYSANGVTTHNSLIFQLPAASMNGTAVVFSPLIALMKDQVDKMRRLGLSAARITSDLSQAENDRTIRRLHQYKLVYVAPERLKSSEFMERIRTVPLSFVGIDECHCLNKWSRDFRPAYKLVGRFIHQRQVPMMALTATADTDVEQEVMRQLDLPYTRIVGSPYRDNLEFRSVTELQPLGVGRIISQYIGDGSAIVYCSTRKSVESLTRTLQFTDVNAVGYHAGMPSDLRTSVQEQFMNGQVPVIVATNAFGMGIDKINIRLILHFGITGSLFDYLQEAGRAGRDGKPSVCALNISRDGIRTREWFIQLSNPKIEVYENLWTTIAGSVAVGRKFRISADALNRVAGVMDFNSASVDSALRFMEWARGIYCTPGLKHYNLPVLSIEQCRRFERELRGVRLNERRGQVQVVVAGGGNDPVNMMVEARAVRFAYPQVEVVIRRLTQDCPIDRHMVDEKEARERARLDQMIQFSRSADKRAFIDNVFLPKER